MHHYAMADFLSYYTGSWLLHPKTGAVVRVIRDDPENRQTHVRLSDKTSVPLSELDWKHVQTPRLGYRCLEGGRLLYYVSRRASRIREKGVTPAAIVIDVPNVVASIAGVLGYVDTLSKHAALGDKLAPAIFNPEFVTLKDAMKALKSKKHAIGFALSNDWAVTLGLHKENPFLLSYKNARVGSSMDGESWKFSDTDAQYIFDRSCL